MLPDRRSPNRSNRVHSPLDWIPSRVPHHSSATRSSRVDSPEVPLPFDDVDRASPIWKGVPLPSRFRPQAFSASRRFPGSPDLAALFHAAAVQTSPFRAFPSQRARSPLSRPVASLRSSTRVQDARPDTVHLRFPRRPRQSAQLPGSPVGYGLPFHDYESRFPVPLGAARPGSPLPLSSPASKPCSPCESVHPSRSWRPLLSWSFAPPGLSPRGLGISNPSSRRRATPKGVPRLGSTPRDPRAARATRGPRTRASARERTNPRAVTLAAG